MLTIDQAHFMPEIEILQIEPTPCGSFGVHTSFPLAALH
jgi:hypothetical protein